MSLGSVKVSAGLSSLWGFWGTVYSLPVQLLEGVFLGSWPPRAQSQQHCLCEPCPSCDHSWTS